MIQESEFDFGIDGLPNDDISLEDADGLESPSAPDFNEDPEEPDILSDSSLDSALSSDALLELAQVANWPSTSSGGPSSEPTESRDDAQAFALYPLPDYDPNLNRPLFSEEEPEGPLPTRLELRIDEFVASVAEATTERQQEIAEAIQVLGVARLRRWLPWLRQQDWTGDRLLTFLKFRELWDENDFWWECSFWSRSLACWLLVWNRGYLSLDDTYHLVNLRSNRGVEEVIDESWFQDWQRLALWKSGFYTFASFALFRSEFGDDPSWRYHCPDPDPHFHQDESVSEKPDLCPRLSLTGPPAWFRGQDWFHESEWNDNLGW